MERSFIYLNDCLHQDTCAYLTDFLQKSSTDGTAVQDEQCPQSWSVTKHPILDRVLEEFLPRMEQETGKKLFPAYSYARLYKKGEVLKCHVDRESCEISATITLGFSGDVWPLWIADWGNDEDEGIVGENGDVFRVKNKQQISMNVGDAVIYYGCEQPHWRDSFSGDWQAQIFLHYVDQNGKFVDFKYDKREKLSHHEDGNNCQQSEEIFYWFLKDAISHGSCDAMIEKFEQVAPTKGMVGSASQEILDLNTRDVNKLDITNEIGIGATLTGIGLNANNRAWKFNITRSNQSEYLRYDESGHYRTHVDTSLDLNAEETRKLTVLAFLNDDFEGGRFYIKMSDKKIYPEQEKGTVLVFPSFIHHGVEPVKSGIRRSIVTWMVGPFFK